MHIKRRVLNSAPKLDYDLFYNSSYRDSARIYLEGLLNDLPLIRRINLTDAQYDRILHIFLDTLHDVQMNLTH
jgi:hypothetical protein